MVLYQIAVSHYCEKARWALTHKRLPFKAKSMLPGLHSKPAKKMTGQTGVPILKDGKNIIHNSADIISYLDEEFPRFNLTPTQNDLREQAIEWESYADSNIGPSTRLLAYSVLLERPDILIPMFGYDGPWYKGFVLTKAFPKIKSALIKALPISDESISRSRQVLHEAMERVLSSLEKKQSDYLVGDGFGRADLAVAALFAPIFQPQKYPMEWPISTPLELQNIESEFSEIKPWINLIYSKHR